METSASATVERRGDGPAGSDQQDALLLGLVVRRDRAAFESLYRDYQPRLTRFVGRFTRRRELVEEIVNDTLWTVWEKAGTFRGASRVSTWIMGIAYRRALSTLRLPEGEPQEHDPLHEASAVDESAGDDDAREWLARGLRCLPVEQRTTLELAYYLGHSLEEIAGIMNCPVGTVKARMFRARVRLRNVLPALGGVEEAR